MKTDYNCSIYIPTKNINDALFYLQMRDIKYKSQYNIFNDKYEISTSEQFSKILDNCAKRFSK